MPSVKRKIARNTIANFISQAWSYIIGFFMLPFIIHYVGDSDYGIYLLVGAFVGYFGLLDFGMGATVTRYSAEAHANNNQDDMNAFVSAAFLYNLVIGISICVFLLIIGTYYVEIFNLSPDDIEKGKIIAYITAIGALTSWPIRSISSTLMGIQRYDLAAITKILSSSLTTTATIITLLLGYGIVEIVLVGVIFGSISQILTAYYVKKEVPYLSINLSQLKWPIFKRMFKFSSVAFMGSIIALLVYGTDRIIIGLVISAAAVTYYAIAKKIHDLVLTASWLPSSALLPAATELATKNKEGELEDLVLKASKIECAAILSMTSLLLPLTGNILVVWMGNSYLHLEFPIKVFLSYWYVFAAWGVLGSILMAVEKLKPIMILNTITASMNVILSIVLTIKWGIIGVMLGTVIPYAIVIPFYIPYALKLLKIKYFKYISEVLIRTYPPAILQLIVTGILAYYIIPDTLMELGVVSLISIATFAIPFFYGSLSKLERIDLIKYMKSIIGIKAT